MTSSERFTITLHATDEIEAQLTQFERDRSSGRVELRDYAPKTGDESYGAVITELARIDLEYAFDDGDTLDASQYIDLFPDVFADQIHRTQIAFEEYRLRRRRGQDLNATEMAKRYEVDASEWQCVESEPSKIQTKTDATFPSVHYPKVGDTIAGYPLIQRLGEGAFSRVFLARQPDLVSRLVVVKVTPVSTEESDQLAQLQHTNIIPIYSIHRERDLTCICMPFLGSTTLADLCSSNKRWTSLDGPAQELVSTIANRSRWTLRGLAEQPRSKVTQTSSTNAKADAASQIQDESSDDDQPERQNVPDLSRLAQLGYIDALLTLVVGAVEGLSHAHERGIVHRDLKPANILVTDDGRAVLLDFNLAVSRTEQKTRLVGGTLPYMSPQQLDAIETRAPADPRDDVFSMGVILYELLSGKLPFQGAMPNDVRELSAICNDRHQSPASLRLANKRISIDLESIVFRCLAADREDRYQNAGQLLEDLNLHRQHLPLRHAPNVSVQERVTKWVARHPRLASASTVGVVAVAALLMSAFLIWKRGDHIERLDAQAKLQQFESDLPEVVLLLSTPGREPEILQHGLDRSSQLLQQWKADVSPWNQNAAAARLEETSQQYLASELAQLSYLMAAADADISLQSANAEKETRRLSALRWNRLAIELDPSIGPLAQFQRHRITSRLDGFSDEQVPSMEADVLLRPELQALLAAESGDAIALRKISLAQLQKHPTDLIAWFNLSTAHWRAGELDDAVAGFNVCDRMRPGWFVTVFNRGLCNLERGNAHDAVDDFTACLRIQPQSQTARFNRAVAFRQDENLASSLEDLDAVIASGKTTSRMQLMRSQVHNAMGNRKQAALDRDAAMTIAPQDANDWVARGVSRLAESPETALADFTAARRIDPQHYSALQNSAHVLSERLSRPKEAIELLGQLVEIRKSDPSPLASRGILFARMGDIDSALRDASDAEARNPTALEELQLAGIYALVANQVTDTTESTPDQGREKALYWIARAIRSDPGLAYIATSDGDLASLRDDDQFQRLIDSGKLLESSSR